MNLTIEEKAYKNNALVKDILKEYVDLSTIVSMNTIRGEDRKVNDWVTKLEISFGNILLLKKFPNVEDLLVNVKPEDYSSSRYNMVLKNDSLKNLTIRTNISPNTLLPKYKLPNNFEDLNYLNIDDFIIYEGSKFTYYDDPFMNKSNFTDIFSSIFNGVNKEIQNFVIFTNSTETFKKIDPFFSGGFGGSTQLTLSPLKNSKYGDYSKLLEKLKNYANYSPEIRAKSKYQEIERIKHEGFDDFYDDESYLYENGVQKAYITEKREIKVYSEILEEKGRDIIGLFRRISVHPEAEKLSSKYNLYGSVAGMYDQLYIEKWIEYVKYLSSFIPITLGDIDDFIVAKPVKNYVFGGPFNSYTSYVGVILKSKLLDLEKTLKRYEYLPDLEGETLRLTEIQGYAEKIEKIYPEYKLFV